MDVNVKRAVKMFFSKSSFEMIYFEAFANALDAGATEFSILIRLPETGDWQHMSLELNDNGGGFTEERFNKFKRLLDVDERTHKGLGRLVYLCYFDRVKIESVYSLRIEMQGAALCLPHLRFHRDGKRNQENGQCVLQHDEYLAENHFTLTPEFPFHNIQGLVFAGYHSRNDAADDSDRQHDSRIGKEITWRKADPDWHIRIIQEPDHHRQKSYCQ